ncbi:hypothetical protein [Psychroflexus tropicus]|uniref:hypothetical protein n=1 Tax=Psychroflexus tropicus TaxID=197345 RepID=UPI000362FED7|nr:hypothetical protein [Psychroflexus tropicus]
MLKLKTIYTISFYLILSFTFLIGGLLQFIIGLSNTGLTIVLGFVMLLNYIVYALVKKKIMLNWVFISFLLYMLSILISALFNGTNTAKTLIYLNFSILPLSTFYFFYINRKEGYLNPRSYLQFILFIACIQLPVLLIQGNFYDQLMTFNNSGQNIASFDFLYGTFLVKSDHSLGCFLLFIIAGLLFDFNNISNYVKYRFFYALYLSITVLLAESNISKALLISTWAIYIIYLVYSRIPKSIYNRKFYIIVTSLAFVFLVYNIRNIGFITSKLGGTIENNYTVEKAKYFYDEAKAKRLQIIIVAINELETKYIGSGPYSYFDILTGKFKNTIHFSQFIWCYFDLGLFGLLTLLFYIYHLIRSTLKKNQYLFIFIFPITIIYMMYTTPFSEIGILISLFLIFSIKYPNEFNNNTIPRLEKK